MVNYICPVCHNEEHEQGAVFCMICSHPIAIKALTHLSLFSGIGGLDIAAEWAGFHSIGQCEWADYPTKILEKHWPDIHRWRDIRTLTGGDFYERTGLRTVDIISGGFPCQPFSVAGKRRGEEDDRYFWPEMLRVIRELRPTWVVGENVAGIVNMALDQVLFDLENQGYETRTFIIPACGVDAPHRRERVAIVAHARCDRCGWSGNICDIRDLQGGADRQRKTDKPCESSKISATMANTYNPRDRTPSNGDNAEWTTQDGGREKQPQYRACRCCKVIPYPNCTKRENPVRHQNETRRTGFTDIYKGCATGEWWAVEPDVGRVANGIPNRVDRLRCLGNAVVPQQFYPIFKAIYDVSFGRECADG